MNPPADPGGTYSVSRSVGFATFMRPAGLFIHDFVPINLPFGALVGAFAHYVGPDMIRDLVIEAWQAELAELMRVIGGTEESDLQPSVSVKVGEPRSRRDALVVPLEWESDSDGWIAPIEADLEVVAYGPRRSHLHILGTSVLPPGVDSCSERASLEHRLTVAVVRHVLFALAAAITTEVGRS